MKKFSITIALLFFFFLGFSQQKQIKKIKRVGNLEEVTIYYENGKVMQHGFLTKKGKLHASWESYYENGNKKCVATYNKGKKIGTWFYYKDDKKTKVTYKDNKIVKVEKPLEGDPS